MLLAAIAIAAPDPGTPLPVRRPEAPRVRLNGPPTRLTLGSRFREGTVPAFHLEGAVQPVRSRWLAVEVTIGGTPNHALDLPGPWRTLASVDGGVDLSLEPSPWLGFGPSAGVSYRMYGQQGASIQDGWTPVAGAHVDVQVLRTRTWGLALAARGLADLTRTELVLETAAVERLSPLEVSLGLETRFGHGKHGEGTP